VVSGGIEAPSRERRHAFFHSQSISIFAFGGVVVSNSGHGGFVMKHEVRRFAEG
jgi:hypothetical protein